MHSTSVKARSSSFKNSLVQIIRDALERKQLFWAPDRLIVLTSAHELLGLRAWEVHRHDIRRSRYSLHEVWIFMRWNRSESAIAAMRVGVVVQLRQALEVIRFHIIKLKDHSFPLLLLPHCSAAQAQVVHPPWYGHRNEAHPLRSHSHMHLSNRSKFALRSLHYRECVQSAPFLVFLPSPL